APRCRRSGRQCLGCLADKRSWIDRIELDLHAAMEPRIGWASCLRRYQSNPTWPRDICSFDRTTRRDNPVSKRADLLAVDPAAQSSVRSARPTLAGRVRPYGYAV